MNQFQKVILSRKHPTEYVKKFLKLYIEQQRCSMLIIVILGVMLYAEVQDNAEIKYSLPFPIFWFLSEWGCDNIVQYYGKILKFHLLYWKAIVLSLFLV